jgi:hypothetical protein
MLKGTVTHKLIFYCQEFNSLLTPGNYQTEHLTYVRRKLLEATFIQCERSDPRAAYRNPHDCLQKGS